MGCDSSEGEGMKEQYEWIINYLKENAGWVSPTKIGREYGKTIGKYYHSSWASPKCLKLIKMNLIIRNEDGHYAFPHEYGIKESK